MYVARDKKGTAKEAWELRHVVIADYRLSTIMELLPKIDGHIGDDPDESSGWNCEIMSFDQSLNIISNLLSESWIPRLDSFTSYMGEQCVDLSPSQSFYAFRTISSDDIEWDVFFNI